MTTITTPEAPSDERAVSPWTTLLLAAACGMLVANLYYAQPLAGPISSALGMSPHATGLIVTLTQIGYGTGLLLIVPLCDLFENRRLVLIMISVCALALLGAALAPAALPFLAAALFIGFGSVGAQILVPYAAHIAPDAIRGQVVGNVMSGLLLGVMLARPVSSFIAEFFAWQAVFLLSAALMVALAVLVRWALPPRMPASKLGYFALLTSLGHLAARTPVLQRRGLYHGLNGAAFSLFWTTTPLLLAGPFHLSQAGIGLFALAGVGGAIAAPIGGRLADRGFGRATTAFALLLVAAAFSITLIAPEGSAATLALLVAAAILIDSGTAANMSVGQRMIFSLGVEARGRLNGLYTACFFVGGGFGSALGGWAYAQGGWSYAACLGLAMPVAAFLVFLTE
ncbi:MULTISPECIES: MFS transporter [Rhodomicrobium]|uniref:MFS transporter n=1 Tax=Rhodomicrobium TaxID=1068 RepID=UPI000B4AD779|nr:MULTISPECIES: MFS transporter [Rhodomicrobium]